MKILANFILLIFLAFPGVSAAENDAAGAAKAYMEGRERAMIEDLIELLSLPNVAANLEDIYSNAEYIRPLLEARGFETDLLTVSEDSRPAIFGYLDTGAEKTVTIYIHYDGQPVDLARWATPPFEGTLKAGRLEDAAQVIDLSTYEGPFLPDFRIYGRSASDDKAPIIALLYALDALKAAGIQPSVNIKLFLDGEEEAGSEELLPTIEKYKDQLQSDYWLFFDGPQDQRGNPRVVLGVRGITGFDITAYGPVRGLHSGHYGNFSPNPSLMLAHLLASMRDEDGQTTIAGFFDEVRAQSQLESELIAAIPRADEMIMADAGISARENPHLRYEETHLIPALNIRGLKSGGVGDNARNIIDTEATASIGIRMVPDMTIAKTREVVEAHIRAQGYHIIDHEPSLEERLQYPKIARVDWGSGGYPAVRTGADDPFVQRTIAIMQEITGGETLVYPILGGSLPLAHIVLPLGVPFSIVPIANQDNSQHAPNENIRLGHLLKGVEIYAALLAGIGNE